MIETLLKFPGKGDLRLLKNASFIFGKCIGLAVSIITNFIQAHEKVS